MLPRNGMPYTDCSFTALILLPSNALSTTRVERHRPRLNKSTLLHCQSSDSSTHMLYSFPSPYPPGYSILGLVREEIEQHQQMNEGGSHTTPGLDDATTPIYAVDGGRWRIPSYHRFQMPPGATPHEYQTHMYSNIAPADNRDTRRCPECDASDLEDWGDHMKLHAQRKANPFNWLTCD